MNETTRAIEYLDDSNGNKSRALAAAILEGDFEAANELLRVRFEQAD